MDVGLKDPGGLAKMMEIHKILADEAMAAIRKRQGTNDLIDSAPEERISYDKKRTKIAVNMAQHILSRFGAKPEQDKDLEITLDVLRKFLVEFTDRNGIDEEFLTMSIIEDVNKSFFQQKFANEKISGVVFSGISEDEVSRSDVYQNSGFRINNKEANEFFELHKDYNLKKENSKRGINNSCIKEWENNIDFYFNPWVIELWKWAEKSKKNST
jgi:hypothetical protein